MRKIQQNSVYLSALTVSGFVCLLQVFLHLERNNLGQSQSSWVTRNAGSWTRTSLQMRRKNCIAQAVERATEPRTRHRIPTEGAWLGEEEEAGCQTGTKLRSMSNQPEPIIIFTEERATESYNVKPADTVYQQCGISLNGIKKLVGMWGWTIFSRSDYFIIN